MSTADDCVNAFCKLMNEKAVEPVMTNSTFNDPVGVNNYSTANDILRCLIKAGKSPVICDIRSKPSYVIKTHGAYFGQKLLEKKI